MMKQQYQKAFSGKRIFLTGCAGFIGSHLLERLLRLGSIVVGMDNLSTGSLENLESVRLSVSKDEWSNFRFIQSCITDGEAVRSALAGVEIILHQAALGSVPRSFENPLASNKANVEGFLTVLNSSLTMNIPRFVYASSSTVYGTDTSSPKTEDRIGKPLSPYGATKQCGELYATAFAPHTETTIVGLRYFNVFGKRQNPHGAYVAVLPRWLGFLKSGQRCVINGDGSIQRDFCFIENVVDANLRAAISILPKRESHVFNIACGRSTSLKDLYQMVIQSAHRASKGAIPLMDPEFAPPRQGDIPFSLADISNAKKMLGYEPLVHVPEGVERTVSSAFATV